MAGARRRRRFLGRRTPVRVLVVNAGSSSLKLRVLADGDVVATEDLPAGKDGFDDQQVAAFLRDTPVDAVGHRVVHGGTQFTAPTVMTPQVVDALHGLTDLAPL